MLTLYLIYLIAGYILNSDASEYGRGYKHGRRALYAAVAISVILTKVWDDVRDASVGQRECAPIAKVQSDKEQTSPAARESSLPELKMMP